MSVNDKRPFSYGSDCLCRLRSFLGHTRSLYCNEHYGFRGLSKKAISPKLYEATSEKFHVWGTMLTGHIWLASRFARGNALTPCLLQV